MTNESLRIYSWNVNGLRAALKKGFLEWLDTERPDVLGLQEVRATPEQLPQEILEHPHYGSAFVAAERKGYSGVGLLSKHKSKFEDLTIGKEFDSEGRLQIGRIGALTIVNGYFPNGNGQDRDNSRVPFKLEFYARLRAYLKPAFDRGEPLLVMGDFNTAHQAIDLARPAQNKKTSGFLPEECASFDEWMIGGWVDTFRQFHAGEGHYSWWSQRAGVREKNIGWRIDYILASPGAMPFLLDANIHSDIFGSDHCPVSVRVDAAILKAGLGPDSRS